MYFNTCLKYKVLIMEDCSRPKFTALIQRLINHVRQSLTQCKQNALQVDLGIKGALFTFVR